MNTMTNIFDTQYSLDKSRIFTEVVCKLRNEIYPSEMDLIQSVIRDNCTDIDSIEVSEIRNPNTITLIAKNKKKGINITNLHSTLYAIIGDIYQRNIINIYGKDHMYSKIDIERLFNIVSYGEQIEILL